MGANIAPYTRASMSFSGLIAAGSGVIVQGTYTVPAGARAELILSTIEVTGNAAAAGTLVGGFVTIITGATGRTHRFNGTAAANLVASTEDMNIPLAAGDQVTMSTQNTSAVAVTIGLSVFFREYL